MAIRIPGGVVRFPREEGGFLGIGKLSRGRKVSNLVRWLDSRVHGWIPRGIRGLPRETGGLPQGARVRPGVEDLYPWSGGHRTGESSRFPWEEWRWSGGGTAFPWGSGLLAGKAGVAAGRVLSVRGRVV